MFNVIKNYRNYFSSSRICAAHRTIILTLSLYRILRKLLYKKTLISRHACPVCTSYKGHYLSADNFRSVTQTDVCVSLHTLLYISNYYITCLFTCLRLPGWCRESIWLCHGGRSWEKDCGTRFVRILLKSVSLPSLNFRYFWLFRHIIFIWKYFGKTGKCSLRTCKNFQMSTTVQFTAESQAKIVTNRND